MIPNNFHRQAALIALAIALSNVCALNDTVAAPALAAQAQQQSPPVNTKQHCKQLVTYKGAEIFIKRDGNKPELYVGGRQIEVVQNTDTGRYQTRYLPYTNYASLLDLAQDVIDSVGF